MTLNNLNWSVGGDQGVPTDLENAAEEVYWQIKDADTWAVREQHLLDELNDINSDVLSKIAARTDLVRRKTNDTVVCWTIPAD